MIQTARTLVGDPNSRAISLATRKTACPIIDPTITAIADHRPRPRIRPGALSLSHVCIFPRVAKASGQTHCSAAQPYQETEAQSEGEANCDFLHSPLLLARLDHAASVIINADHRIGSPAVVYCVAGCVDKHSHQFAIRPTFYR